MWYKTHNILGTNDTISSTSIITSRKSIATVGTSHNECNLTEVSQ